MVRLAENYFCFSGSKLEVVFTTFINDRDLQQEESKVVEDSERFALTDETKFSQNFFLFFIYELLNTCMVISSAGMVGRFRGKEKIQ